MIESHIVLKYYAENFVHLLHANPSMALATLLAGDRWECVDEAVLVEISGETVGIATIARDGERESGEPTIVAIYVLPEHRRRGVALALLETAVDHLVSEGLTPIHVDAMHSGILRLAEKLPQEKRRVLNVVDQSMGGALDAMLEV